MPRVNMGKIGVCFCACVAGGLCECVCRHSCSLRGEAVLSVSAGRRPAALRPAAPEPAAPAQTSRWRRGGRQGPGRTLPAAQQRPQQVFISLMVLMKISFMFLSEDPGVKIKRLHALSESPLASLCFSVVVVATVCRPRDLSAGVMAAFVHQVALENPNEEQRHAMLVSLSRELHLGRDVNLERLSQLTAVRQSSDIQELIQTRTGTSQTWGLLHQT